MALTEHFYIHNFVLSQSKGTDENQPREGYMGQSPGKFQTQSLQLSPLGGVLDSVDSLS